jgi:hypothetical protein
MIALTLQMIGPGPPKRSNSTAMFTRFECAQWWTYSEHRSGLDLEFSTYKPKGTHVIEIYIEEQEKHS